MHQRLPGAGAWRWAGSPHAAQYTGPCMVAPLQLVLAAEVSPRPRAPASAPVCHARRRFPAPQPMACLGSNFACS